MTALRGTAALSRAYLLRSVRSRTSLFWNFAFPLLWLFVFGYVFAGGTTEGVAYLLPGLFVITILAISFAGVSYRLVNERERGTLRRYRVTPVRAPAIVLSTALAA
ncbi:MAG: ABC transporter permease, partial [Gemmatimonadota bacterium]|nr:ABC transporter permease [Gemmatimonadota bacterium]